MTRKTNRHTSGIGHGWPRTLTSVERHNEAEHVAKTRAFFSGLHAYGQLPKTACPHGGASLRRCWRDGWESGRGDTIRDGTSLGRSKRKAYPTCYRSNLLAASLKRGRFQVTGPQASRLVNWPEPATHQATDKSLLWMGLIAETPQGVCRTKLGMAVAAELAPKLAKRGLVRVTSGQLMTCASA